MKRMNKKTFILNELKNLSGLNTTNLKRLASLKQSRVNECLFYYLYNFEHKSFDSNLFNIQVEVLKFKNNMNCLYDKAIEKYDGFWTNYQNEDKRKLELVDSFEKSGSIKYLNKVCKQLNVNYGNAYKYFVKREISALKIIDALKIQYQIRIIAK